MQRGRGARGGGVAFGKMQSFALRRLGFLGRASSGKELRCDTWMLYRALGKRFGKQIPESTGSVRWEISRPSPTRSRREEGDERRPVGPACQRQGRGKERAQRSDREGRGGARVRPGELGRSAAGKLGRGEFLGRARCGEKQPGAGWAEVLSLFFSPNLFSVFFFQDNFQKTF